MGNRCNLVTIENNRTTVYYDHWAAAGLHFELLWGPGIARAFIEEGNPSDFWVCNSSSEGGCVVDFDTKHLLWYGGGDVRHVPELNLMHQDLIDIQWKGWTVEWAKDGIFDIAKKAGVPIDVVTYDGPRDSELLHQTYTYTDEDTGETFLYASAVVSCVDKGEFRWAILNGEVECLENVEVTPEKIAKLVRNFSEATLEINKAIDPEWGFYRWGAHLNLDTCSLEYWTPNPCEGLEKLIKTRLPRWSVVFHGPNYLWQEALVPAKDWPVISSQKKLALIDEYRQRLSRDRTNPVIDIIKTLGDEGAKNIRLNPHALKHRKGRDDLLEMKSAILDYLEIEIRKKSNHST